MSLSPALQQALDVALQEETALRARRDQLMAQVRDIDSELQTLTRVRKLIHPDPPKQANGKTKQGDWAVSETAVVKVWEEWQKVGESSPTRLAEGLPGTSPETTRRATEVLRERGYVVISGKARGGGTLYRVAPDAPDMAKEVAI